MKCKNIFCERQDEVQPTGCRILDCKPNMCVLNNRFKKLQNTTHNSDYTKSPENVCNFEKEIQDYFKKSGHDYCPICGGEFV